MKRVLFIAVVAACALSTAVLTQRGQGGDVAVPTVADMAAELARRIGIDPRVEIRTSVDRPAAGDLDEAGQDEESVLDEIEHVPVIARLLDPPWMRLLSSPIATVAASPATDDPLPPMLFVNRGGSTGDVFNVRVVNRSSSPLRLPPMMVTLRPLKKGAGQTAAQAFAQAGKSATVKMAGYCLQFKKKPPSEETIYAVAPAEAQARSEPARLVFHAARVLQTHRLLHVQGDAAAYFHSIRQWAWWTREQKFTEKTYTEALVDYTRRNLANAGQAWNKEREAYVRSSAVGRWADISTVLEIADRVTPGLRKSRP